VAGEHSDSGTEPECGGGGGAPSRGLEWGLAAGHRGANWLRLGGMLVPHARDSLFFNQSSLLPQLHVSSQRALYQQSCPGQARATFGMDGRVL
jgi:hypothetical protein